MLENNSQIKAPLSWRPAGLISWYTPGGVPVALVTSWVAIVCGTRPRIKTAWHGRDSALSRFWTGGDFVFNVPSARCLEEIYGLMKRGKLCLNAETDLAQSCVSGQSSLAPILMNCAIQLECTGGLLQDSAHDMELTGTVVAMHRGQGVVHVEEIPDLCALHPLTPLTD